MSANQHFRLRMLGGLAIDRGGHTPTPVLLPRNNLSILAILGVAAPHGVSRDRLLAWRWPDSDTARARNSLDQALFGLRRSLGPDLLTQTSSELCLNSEVVASDLGDFEKARQAGDYQRAAALYQGAFLDGFHLRNAREFERWVDGERARIAGEYADVLERLASTSEDRLDWHAAAEWWRRLGDLDQLNSRVARRVARALVNSGQRSAAQRYARAHDVRVAEELGALAPADPTLSRYIEELHDNLVHEQRQPAVDDHPVALATRPAPPPNATVADTGEPDRASANLSALRSKAVWIGTAILAALILVTMASAIFRRPMPDLDPDRVVVLQPIASRATDQNDVLAAELRERLETGIAETHLATVVSHAVTIPSQLTTERAIAIGRAARARYVLSARYALDGDSLLISAQIADVKDAAMIQPVEPVHGPRSARRPMIDLLRNRMMAALAARLDPKMARWSYAASMPTTFESYRELRLGIDAFVVDQQNEAMSHFRSSAALDTTSAAPLVWLAFASAFHQYWRDAEWAVATLEASKRSMGAWDRALLDDVKAWIAGDLASAHLYARRLVEVVPNSEWAFLLGWDIWNLGRAGEAIAALRQIDPDQGWLRGLVWYWWALTQAHHLLGDYKSELAAARDAIRRDPDNSAMLGMEERALVGLGRTDDARKRCVDRMRLRAPRRLGSGDCKGTIYELRAHGYTEAARSLANEMVSSIAAVPEIRTQGASVAAATFYYWAGDFKEAERMLHEHPVAAPDDAWSLELRTFLAAARGNRAAVDSALPIIEQLYEGDAWGTRESTQSPYRHAQMAALLGNRTESVTWLARALSAGFRWPLMLHWDPAFDRLRGYAPFEALARPVRDENGVRKQ